MYEVVKTKDGCFQLRENATYAKIFSIGPNLFIQNVDTQVNPLLASNGTSCPNETAAKMVIFLILRDI